MLGLRATIVYALIQMLTALEAGFGPGYDSEQRVCAVDGDCDLGRGEACIYLYQGCSVGLCMCDPAKQRRHPTTLKCINVMLGGEKCAVGDQCADGMACRRGVCTCYTGRLMADGLHCKRETERLLGERCTLNIHTCIQKASYGYTKDEVLCSKAGYCQCVKGYKQDGNSCAKWNLGQWGCTENFQCQGGAVCRSGQCACPSGRHATAGNTKCSRYGAITDLPLGATCNEIDEQKYCAEGLVCHTCGRRNLSRCVKSRVASDFGYLIGQGTAILLIPYSTLTALTFATLARVVHSLLAR